MGKEELSKGSETGSCVQDKLINGENKLTVKEEK